MNKKKLFALAMVVCMLAILSFSTLAWFSDADEVKNIFQVATSDDANDPDDIFSVDVWEYDDKDGDGLVDDDEKDQDGIVYNNILPGGRYHKEPHVENTGSYNQWIRVKVTVSCASVFQNRLGANYDLSKIFEGHDETAWTRGEITADTTADTLTYVYYLNYRLEAGKDATLFNTVVMPIELTQDDMAAMGGAFSINVVAEAVQGENTGTTAQAAFALVEQTQTIE